MLNGPRSSPPNAKAQRTRTAEIRHDTTVSAAAVRGPLQREVRRQGRHPTGRGRTRSRRHGKRLANPEPGSGISDKIEWSGEHS